MEHLLRLTLGALHLYLEEDLGVREEIPKVEAVINLEDLAIDHLKEVEDQ